jgi:catechol 2,3-dioxygenase
LGGPSAAGGAGRGEGRAARADDGAGGAGGAETWALPRLLRRGPRPRAPGGDGVGPWWRRQPALIELVERPGPSATRRGRPLPRGPAPARPRRLGHAIRRLLASGAKLTGAADHIVSEAVYLDDPDGHGIEVYADRPRASWPAGDGDRLRIDNLPLDRAGIMAAADRDPAGAARTAGVVVGHVHLETHDLPAARSFYLDRLGFELMADRGKAVFMAADGYHHHLAANVWGRRTRAYVDAADRLGLLYYTMALPDGGAVQALAATLDAEPLGGEVFRVRDPSGIEVRLAVA